MTVAFVLVAAADMAATPTVLVEELLAIDGSDGGFCSVQKWWKSEFLVALIDER